MFENRVREFVAPLATQFVATESASVALPTPLFTILTPAHQAFIAEVYRAAQTLTQAQLQQANQQRCCRIPGFSLN